MRIALVSSNLHPVPSPTWGAVEAQMAAHAGGLAARGHEVHVLTVGAPDGPTADGEGSGAGGRPAGAPAFHRLGPAFEHAGGGGLAGLLASQWHFARRVRARLDELAPEVVHWHARYPARVGLAGPERRRPWASVFHAHNWKRAESMRWPAASPRRAAALAGARVDAEVARRADHVLAVSAFVASHVMGDADLGTDRVSVLTNVVDPARFAPIAPIASGAPGAPEILFVGRLAAEKGLAVLIAAMPAVLRAVPDARLAVIGPVHDGTERGGYALRCRELVQRLGLERSVTFEGPLPNRELPARLARCRVVAVPSVWGEPCGVVVLEALACGVPVVASRVGGIPELLQPGENGVLCAPEDPDALARALADALGDERLARASQESGPARISARHTFERVADGLEAAYERALDHRRRGTAPADGRLRALLVVTSTAGGAGEQALQLARDISRDEFDLSVAFGPGYALDGDFLRLGIPVRVLSLSRRPRPLVNLRGFLQLLRAMRRRRYHVVLTSCSMAGFFGRIAATLAGVPHRVHVIQVYASRAQQPLPRKLFFRWIERALDPLTTRYVAVSGAVQQYGVHTGLMRPDKVEVIYNAAELAEVAPDSRERVRAELDLPALAPVVGTLGRYEPQKGIEHFLRAAARVLERQPRVRFAVVGDGPLRDALERQARQLGIEHAVRFTGWRDDVAEVLHALDVFCLASLWETFGIVLAEAMLAELPVVASRVDGIPEVVADGETGYLVPPGDDRALAEALLRVLDDPDLGRRLGRAGRARSERRFSVPTMVAAYERFLRTLGDRP